MKAAVILLFSAAASALAAGRPSLAEPSLSPDGREIVFVSGGDIWTVPVAGGDARLLVSHNATESRPLYSPDGRRLAFMSNRTGTDEIYVLDLQSGDTRRITHDNSSSHLDAWSRDGKWLYFSSAVRDIAQMSDVYRVSAGGGTPMQVLADRYASEYWAAPSPSGDKVAITAKADMVVSQWWRHGHSHIDESEIWVAALAGDKPAYARLTKGGAKDAWPMWTPEGKRLYFMSDRSGAENIWWIDAAGGAPEQVTTFKQGRVLWPSISSDGKTIVFEGDGGTLWRVDLASAKAAEIPVELRGAPAGPDTTHLAQTAQFQNLRLSPDDKKVAFVSHGEIFATSAKDGGNAARVTTSVAAETDPWWSKDSRRLVFRSDRDGQYHVYVYDFASGKEEQIAKDPAGEHGAQFSPDGKLISYVRGGKSIVVYDPASKQERVVATGWFGRPPGNRPVRWSGDSQWIAYSAVDTRGFQNVWVVPAAGGTPRQISYMPNAFVQTIEWSPDGTYLLFVTGQRTEQPAIVRIDLVPKTPKFREDQFRDLFKDEQPKTPGNPPTPAPPIQPTPAQNPATSPEMPAQSPRSLVAADGAAAKPADATKPPAKVSIVFEGIRLRARVIDTGLDVGPVAISPDGKTLLIEASAAGQVNLYAYSLDELAKEPPVARQLTSTPGFKADPQWSPDSKEVFFLEGGRIQTITVESRQAKPVAVTAEMDVAFPREKTEVFGEAWTYLNDNFYDPQFHGLDWAAVRKRFEPQIEGARTPDEVRRIISLMLGELNASHLGISGGGGGAPGSAPQTGRIGVRFDRAEWEANGRLRVAEVIRLSPADVAGIKAGQYIAAVDGTAIAAGVNFDELLEHKVDRRVALSVADTAGGSPKEVALRPVSTTVEKQLLYREWTESRRDYVHRASNGRLGYVHIPDMSAGSLSQFYLDLDTENQARDGVVVDIRNNNGGFVNAYALDVLSRRHYLNMTPRGMDEKLPARSMLGQRALEKPTILVINQNSLSDAEDFTEGYRSMKLGKVVGEPTAGWIIYTGGVPLIDGSVLRLPSTRITTTSGETMERNPRPVDIRVERAMGEWYAGKDSQLDAAVSELLKEVGGHGAIATN